MCGICGEWSRRGVDERRLLAMRERLAHRGPDDARALLRDDVGLAVRRLAVIDPRHGAQPMANEAGDVWVIHNGEIYNHRELRRRLQEAGHRFRTGSDTEVLVHLY